MAPAGDFHLETLKVASPAASFSAAAPPGGDALAVERSAASVNGGSSFSGPLTAEPEVVTHTLAADDEFLLLGCDGGSRVQGTAHAGIQLCTAVVHSHVFAAAEAAWWPGNVAVCRVSAGHQYRVSSCELCGVRHSCSA
jgi:Protein phosphatase 2C